MHNQLKRLIPLLIAVAVVVPSFASAAEVAEDLRASISTKASQLFHAVVTGDSKGVLSLTIPDFKYTSLEGQELTANDLATKWRIMSIEYGGINGGARLNSIKTDGTAITSIVSVHAAGDTLAEGMGVTTTSLDAVHQLVWVNTRDGWKAASDKVLRSHTTY
jgi:hypothetical protein